MTPSGDVHGMKNRYIIRVTWVIVLIIIVVAISIYRISDKDTLIDALWFKVQGNSPVKLIPQESFNLHIVDQTSRHRLCVRTSSPTQNDWFAGSFTGLSSQRETVVQIQSLNTPTQQKIIPVLSYADPTRYESYCWYTKNDHGEWTSSDIFKSSKERVAGNGTLPQQNILPGNIAKQFMSQDNRYWCPWHFIDTTTMNSDGNLQIIKRFAKPTATIASQIPYTYTYAQTFLKKLSAAHYPGVTIDTAGMSMSGKLLNVIRLSPPTGIHDNTRKPTILLYARENATDPGGSWVLEGALRWLLSDEVDAKKARMSANWLIIPILDVEGASTARQQNSDEMFSSEQPICREAVAAALYIVRWLQSGNTLDIIVNLRNPQTVNNIHIGNELRNNSCINVAHEVSRLIFSQLTNTGYACGSPGDGLQGIHSQRFAGWCNDRYHSIELNYNISLYTAKTPLNLPQIQTIGMVMARELSKSLQQPLVKSTLAARG